MLCPSCGTGNADDAKECMKCGYKFHFGYAFNDPQRMTFFNFSKTGSKKTRMGRMILGILGLVLFVFAVLSWLKAI